MNRRDFLAATATATAVGAALAPTSANAADAPPAAREYYELRRYHLRRGPRQKMFEDYLRQAYLPAAGRAGLGPIGVFHVMLGPESPSIHVLVPYKSMEEFAAVPAKLRADADYAQAAAEVRALPPGDPAYLRAESSLFLAFSSIPKLEVPAQTREGKGRIFELRTYESHNKPANLKKIQMFDQGEIALFRRAGLAPVFFGEALIGARLPNLTYMLVFDDLAARDKAWRTFGGDPEWKTLSSTPGFTDPEIVTDISNILLRPAPYSQI
jgi:hypothetical protein